MSKRMWPKPGERVSVCLELDTIWVSGTVVTVNRRRRGWCPRSVCVRLDTNPAYPAWWSIDEGRIVLRAESYV
jgi:hypothetical protein